VHKPKLFELKIAQRLLLPVQNVYANFGFPIP